MKPNLRNLFMKKLTRDRVVPIISARVSWLISTQVNIAEVLGLGCCPHRAAEGIKLPGYGFYIVGRPDYPNRFHQSEYTPFCNGPVDVKRPLDRHVAELMLLSVVDVKAAT
jgi:hypothetical protein